MIEKRLAESRIFLPNPSVAIGSYLPVVVVGDLAFVSGQIPIENGQLKFKGKVGREITLEEGQQAARLCTLNGLAQVKSKVGSLDFVSRVVKLTGFVNCDPSFMDHPKVVNGASDLLVQIFGDNGKHSRAAVGVSSLPLDSAVEIEFILQLNQQQYSS